MSSSTKQLLSGTTDDPSYTIKNTLQDPTFLPNGGLLGFGLSHAYAVSQTTDLSKITLKGFDATISDIFSQYGIKGRIKAFYGQEQIFDEEDEDEEGFSYYDSEIYVPQAYDKDDELPKEELDKARAKERIDPPYPKYWLTESLVNFSKREYGAYYELNEDFEEAKGAMKVISYNDLGKAMKVAEKLELSRKAEAESEVGNEEEEEDSSGKDEEEPVIFWITPPSKSKTKHESFFIAFGNEPYLTSRYADLNIVYTIPPAEERLR